MTIHRLVGLISCLVSGFCVSNCDRKCSIRKNMRSLLLVAVVCVSGAIRPSSPAGMGNKASRRPLRRLWYRRFDEGSEDLRRNPAVDWFRNSDTSRTKHAFTDDEAPLQQAMSRVEVGSELSTILAGIENFAEELEAYRHSSIPPLGFATGIDAGIKATTSSSTSSSNDSTRTNNNSKVKQTIKTVHELRQAILDEGKELRDLQLDPEAQLLVNATASELLQHDVIQLIVQRFKSGSKPGNRAPGDTARLALSIEGGGMRGAVSAGMAAAIACLGLCDTFDTIYGSSAGSVVGSYIISRQMCMDIYVDILPAAKRTFVCTKRIMSGLAVTAMDMVLSGVHRRAFQGTRNSNKNNINNVNDEDTAEDLPRSRFANRLNPGMNISFVLDGIMDPEHGIRPIDMDTFQKNDKKQPLRVASSYAKDGKLYSKCFGTEHFFGESRAVREDGKREGLFACLEPSMTVPGATGPPVMLKTFDSDEALPYFDAFCFEPLPYRSAVEEGATHVLVLCSRPEGFVPKTKPGMYEQAVTPLYFKSHGEPAVADFFSRGGQQYIYLEDMLTLEEGKVAGMRKQGPISVPPPKLLYGVDADHENHELATQRDEKWKKAHLMPLKVPLGTPELPTLEQDQDVVREAVKGGFAAAFDLLAPAIGLHTHDHLTGDEVAALIFPKKAGMLDEMILSEKLKVEGVHIEHEVQQIPPRRRGIRGIRGMRGIRGIRGKRVQFLRIVRRNVKLEDEDDQVVGASLRVLNGGDSQTLLTTLDNDKQKAEHLLASLPGLKSGRLGQLAANLHHVASSDHPEPENEPGSGI